MFHTKGCSKLKGGLATVPGPVGAVVQVLIPADGHSLCMCWKVHVHQVFVTVWSGSKGVISFPWIFRQCRVLVPGREFIEL